MTEPRGSSPWRRAAALTGPHARRIITAPAIMSAVAAALWAARAWPTPRARPP